VTALKNSIVSRFYAVFWCLLMVEDILQLLQVIHPFRAAGRNWSVGQTVELADRQARAIIAQGYARPIDRSNDHFSDVVSEDVQGTDAIDPEVSVIVPIYRSARYVKPLIESLIGQACDVSTEMVFVDDASPDASGVRIAKLLRKRSGWKLIRLSANTGYSHAVNRGVSHSRGKYLWLLNADTKPEPDALARLLRFAGANSDAGVIGSKTLSRNGKVISVGSEWSSPDRTYVHCADDVSRPVERDMITFASVLIPRNIWDRLGGLDEAYRIAYAEDSDFCMRARDLGLKVFCEPASRVIHKVAHSGRQNHEHLAANLRLFNKRWVKTGKVAAFAAKRGHRLSPKKSITFAPPSGCLGDLVCLISAARRLARQHPELAVSVQTDSKIIEAFGDDLITVTSSDNTIPVKVEKLHRGGLAGKYGNYVGTYCAALGAEIDRLAAPELPAVGPPPYLEPGSYVALQPFSLTAENPPQESIRQLIRAMRKIAPVVIVGKPDTPKHEDATYCLGDEMSLLSVVAHARLVLTPRSASAHVAAGYGVPHVVWVPDDGENWHINYPNVTQVRVPIRDGITGVIEAAHKLLHSEARGYPDYLNKGNAMAWIEERALSVCKGRGLDIGAGSFPLKGSISIDKTAGCDAHQLGQFSDGSLDFVFSSHCLEHLESPLDALRLWTSKLKPGGVLFLYLPHPDMEDWHPGGPFVGDQHKWIPDPSTICDWLETELRLERVKVEEKADAYWSFAATGYRN